MTVRNVLGLGAAAAAAVLPGTKQKEAKTIMSKPNGTAEFMLTSAKNPILSIVAFIWPKMLPCGSRAQQYCACCCTLLLGLRRYHTSSGTLHHYHHSSSVEGSCYSTLKHTRTRIKDKGIAVQQQCLGETGTSSLLYCTQQSTETQQ